MGNVQLQQKPSENSTEEEEMRRSFTCEICIEPAFSNKIFNNSNCSHPSSFCLDCIAKYIQLKVEDNVSEIKCPHLKCQNLLDALSCRSILPPTVFVKWCDVLCDSAVLRYDSRAYCPYPDCSALVLNECGGIKVTRRSECPNCKKLFCFQCKVPWHSGYRCAESTSRDIDRNDLLIGRLIEENKWTRCPTCKHCVELLLGCSIVRCRCNTVFCYACGRKLVSGWCWCKKNLRNNLLFIFLVLLIPTISLVLLIYATKFMPL